METATLITKVSRIEYIGIKSHLSFRRMEFLVLTLLSRTSSCPRFPPSIGFTLDRYESIDQRVSNNRNSKLPVVVWDQVERVVQRLCRPTKIPDSAYVEVPSSRDSRGP